MKRFLVFSSLILLFVISVFSQAKKPTIMVIPSDVWCYNNGYMQEFDNLGTKTMVPNYELALQTNMDLKVAISTVNTLMADNDFPLKDMEQAIKSLKASEARRNMSQSKGGATIAESPKDALLRTAQPDIVLELTWDFEVTGPKKTITCVLEGKDSYTSKSIGGKTVTGRPSFSSSIQAQIQEAIAAGTIVELCNALQRHFNDLFENGREVTMEVLTWDNGSGIDLETEYNGMELAEIIDEWMDKNTLNGRYSKLAGSENFISYEQVRIPLYKENGGAMDCESFIRQLSRYLRSEPYKLTSKVEPVGLGNAVLTIGEK